MLSSATLRPDKKWFKFQSKIGLKPIIPKGAYIINTVSVSKIWFSFPLGAYIINTVSVSIRHLSTPCDNLRHLSTVGNVLRHSSTQDDSIRHFAFSPSICPYKAFCPFGKHLPTPRAKKRSWGILRPCGVVGAVRCSWNNYLKNFSFFQISKTIIEICYCIKFSV